MVAKKENDIMTNEQLVIRIRAGEQTAANMLQLWQQDKAFVSKLARRYAGYAEMDDRIIIKPGVKIERGELYELYRAYCVFNQWLPLNNRSFYKNLRGKGFRDYSSSGSRYFDGMCSIDDKSALDSAGFRQATLEESGVFTRK